MTIVLRGLDAANQAHGEPRVPGVRRAERRVRIRAAQLRTKPPAGRSRASPPRVTMTGREYGSGPAAGERAATRRAGVADRGDAADPAVERAEPDGCSCRATGWRRNGGRAARPSPVAVRQPTHAAGAL